MPSLLPDPRGHGKHAVPIRENVFGLQSAHALAPPAELFPALHARHGPPAMEYVYSGQGAQVASASAYAVSLLVPSGQVLQRSAGSPVPLANLLRGQLWHGCPAPMVNLLTGQGMQGFPAKEKWFGRQMRHALMFLLAGGLSLPSSHRRQPNPSACEK